MVRSGLGAALCSNIATTDPLLAMTIRPSVSGPRPPALDLLPLLPPLLPRCVIPSTVYGHPYPYRLVKGGTLLAVRGDTLCERIKHAVS